MEPEKLQSEKTLTMIIYVLYAVSMLGGITAIVAIVMNYAKKGDVAGTFLESHYRWQIRTFWYSLLWLALGVLTALIALGGVILWSVLSALTFMIVIGGGILFANGIWVIYRIVKGLLRLNDNKAMYTV